MRTLYQVALPVFLLTALALPPAAAESVPSYEQAREQFEAERKQKSKGSKLSPEDQRIMQQAGEDLAENMPDPGLKIGEKAPDFTLPNAFGDSVSLYEQLKKGPVVLVFYRGAWCPYCNLQLHTLRESLPAIKAEGAQLITVTPQKPDKSLKQVKEDDYPFEILSDLDSSAMKAYNLYFEVPMELVDVYRRNFGLDLADYNGDGRYVLPVPATYIIDREGVIRAGAADVDYKERMEPAAIVEALQQL
ncbi:peroxiredoxin-like family protein [Thiohalophilus thiocyanatoxydans]|uniref:thioredoxin-dependent peroxiredoxin n=1 Tax=Thiohalophilus thiocyanatoxydans TaxID=381308 RepID=A0A4R8IIR2_9GAMM|nr:peroxiredoxin-like family protein [Thiohalophilus thiocyanatoxydans]TDY00562.1 peroxiredoxin [Thiohalophilus thiocyanatoxydans]